jgi:hypothetical protein
MAEFSFEQDVAPYASRYFQRTQANPLLSTARKTQLSDDLLSKLEAVKKEADADVDRSLALEVRRTQLERERLALDDARLEVQQKREAVAAEPRVGSEFESLLDGVDDSNEQTRRLNIFAMRNANVISRSPALMAKYKFAAEAITKPALTTAQQLAIQQREASEAARAARWEYEQGYEEQQDKEAREARQRREARYDQAAIDRMLDVELEANELEPGSPPRLKNVADRDKLLDFIHRSGKDVAPLEDAPDYDLYKAAQRLRRAATTTATAPLVSFD